jgi:hypothetical protein
MRKEIEEIFKIILENNQIDDRREYDLEDLKKAYNITDRDAADLFEAILDASELSENEFQQLLKTYNVTY